MLVLKALTLENFGPFKGRQRVEFAQDDGVMIIYGENMRGKTSLLNAVRFAFFGRVIGRGSKATSIHEIGNWEEAAVGKYGFQVELEFSSGGHDYKLTRTCRARVTTPTSDADYQVDHFLECDGDVLGPEQASTELARILPEQISRFFLFDGELLQEYEDLLSSESDMGRRISEAIERILGVPVLTSSRATALRMKERSEKREATAAQSDQKTREYGNQLADLHAQRDVLKADAAKLKTDLDGLRTKKATLEEALKRKERYASLMEKKDGLERLVSEQTERLDTKRQELAAGMASAWCTLLAPQMRDAARRLETHREALEATVTRWKVLQELKASATHSCPTCLQKITAEARAALEEAASGDDEAGVQEAREELERVRRRLSALSRFLDDDRGDTLKIRWEAIDELEVDIADKKGQITEINKQLETVDEASLRKDKTEYEQTVRAIDTTERTLTDCEEKLADNKTGAERIQKRLDRLGGNDLQGERARRSLYAKVHELFDEAVSAYRDQLRRRVEADATKHFRALTTEPDYRSLLINDSYGLTIVHKDGSLIPVRSAGAEHVVALCLVGALQNNAPLQGPIIIDSPFGRLDRGHTTNIVRALPTMAKQVMLLVYEDELPAGLARTELKGQLKSEWILVRRSARHTELAERKS